MITSKEYICDIKYPRRIFRTPRAVNADIDKLLADLRKHVCKGLNLGAGNSMLTGLINCDLFNPKADLKVDATNLDIFDDNSIDLIESHHLIEHLSFADSELALKEWYRVLRIGGLLVTTCPDITRICLKWLRYIILYPIFPRPKKLDYILQMMLGSQEHEGMFHKSAYDAKVLNRLLEKYGFKIEFIYAPYPRRLTPSLLTIARKVGNVPNNNV